MRRAKQGETGRGESEEKSAAKGKKGAKDAQRAQRKQEDREAEKQKRRNQLLQASAITSLGGTSQWAARLAAQQ